MFYYVSQDGTWSLVLGGRSDTPILSISNQKKGTILKVSTNFMAITSNNDSKGFYYKINPLNPDEATALTPSGGVFSRQSGWKACTRNVYFEIPVDEDEVNFEVLFSAGDLGGEGSLSNFLLEAQTESI